jgi:hypothetical protein
LVILRRFQHIGGVEGKKKTNRRGPVGRNGAKKKREIQAWPRPRFPGEIFNGDPRR